MSEKTIEVASKHIGPCNLQTNAGEDRTVVFEDRDGTGYAMIDNEEAEILLGAIGRPDYWKPGASADDAVAAALAADPAAAAAAKALLGGGSDEETDDDNDDQGEGDEETEEEDPAATYNIAQMTELINAANTAEEVDEIVGDDPRVGVQKAAAKRKNQIAKQ